MKNIMIIPAKKQVGNIARQQEKKPKLRVAAYCRVSTDTEEQATSYEAQIAHYTEYIQKNPEWEFAGVYADDGISGTNTKKRSEFNRMIEDCEAGNIDMIITKSISRFVQKLAAYYQDNIPYTYQPGITPYGQDFVSYFLKKNPSILWMQKVKF